MVFFWSSYLMPSAHSSAHNVRWPFLCSPAHTFTTGSQRCPACVSTSPAAHRVSGPPPALSLSQCWGCCAAMRTAGIFAVRRGTLRPGLLVLSIESETRPHTTSQNHNLHLPYPTASKCVYWKNCVQEQGWSLVSHCTSSTIPTHAFKSFKSTSQTSTRTSQLCTDHTAYQIHSSATFTE